MPETMLQSEKKEKERKSREGAGDKSWVWNTRSRRKETYVCEQKALLIIWMDSDCSRD